MYRATLLVVVLCTALRQGDGTLVAQRIKVFESD